MHRFVKLAALACAVVLPACANMQELLRAAFIPPTATYQEAKLDGVSFEDVAVTATFALENKNPFGVQIAGVSWTFLFDGKKVLDGKLAGGLNIQPTSTSPLVVPLRVPWASAPGILETFATKDEAPYEVQGIVSIDTPIGPISLPIKWNATVPIPHLPNVSLAGARLVEVSLAGAKVMFDVDVENTNTFPVPFDGLTANVTIGDARIAGVSLLSQAALEPKKVVRLQLPFDVSLTGAGFAAFGAITQKKASLDVKGEAKFAGKSLPINLSTGMR